VIARDGTLLQTILNIGINETDTNSVTGASLTLTGAVHNVFDYASNTRTVSGKVWAGHDQALLFHDVGRIAFTDGDTREPLFLARPHEIFFASDVDPFVCAALAG
jgi:hypothetical protein